MVTAVHKRLANKEICRLGEPRVFALCDGTQILDGAFVVAVLEVCHSYEVKC